MDTTMQFLDDEDLNQTIVGTLRFVDDDLIKAIEQRLIEDAQRNVHSIRFERSLETEQDFLTLTTRENINYVNLGECMEVVMQLYKEALMLKERQKFNNFGEEQK